jgi:hypothetical protein
MEEGSVTVLVDAKEEYTKQLISILKQCIYQGIKSIYMDSKDICNQDNTPEKILMVFQDLLSRIPKWSQDIINKEYERIVNVSKCDYIEDLLKVIYVSHIKVLTIVHSAQKNKKITLKVPNGGHFIHLCYIECAREFWKDPYLFSENVNKYELQKNMRDSEIMIAECITETIRKQLPVRHILKEFLNEPDEDIEEAEEDIKEPVNKKYMKRLETVVKKELKTTSKNSNTGEIDIDLIRKVIREELNSRPDTTTSNVIKKELVETVIEKIVEQAQEEEEESFEDKTKTKSKESDKEETKDRVSVTEPALVQKDTKNSETNESAESAESAENADNADNADNEIKVKSKVKAKVKINESYVNNSKVNNSKEDIERKSESKNKIEEEQKLEDKTESADEIENNSNGIDDLINELDDCSIKLVSDDIVIDNNTDTIPDTTPAEKSNEKNYIKKVNNDSKIENKKEPSALIINNIDEINLNLDELDSDLEEQSELDLEEVDIKVNANEVKKDPNTKYIFFKDA